VSRNEQDSPGIETSVLCQGRYCPLTLRRPGIKIYIQNMIYLKFSHLKILNYLKMLDIMTSTQKIETVGPRFCQTYGTDYKY